MARRFGIASQAGISSGTSAKTLIQLVAATNHAIACTGLSLGGHGTSNTAEPVKVELVRQSSAGTMTSLTPKKLDDSIADTLDTTAQHTATSEPTTGDTVGGPWTMHPQTGLDIKFDRADEIIVGAGDRLGLRVTAAADVTLDAGLRFEE